MDRGILNANPLSPEEYTQNLTRIQHAKAFIARMEAQNEVGREHFEAELRKKIREGEEARQLLSQMNHTRNPTPLRIEEGSSTTRIEEVPAISPPNPQYSASNYPLQSSSHDPHRLPRTCPRAMERQSPYNNQAFDRRQYTMQQQPVHGQPYAGNTVDVDHRHASQIQNPYPNQSDFSSRYISQMSTPFSQSARSRQPPEPFPHDQVQSATFGHQDSLRQSVPQRKPSLHSPSVDQTVPSAQIERIPNPIHSSSAGKVNGNGVPFQVRERPVHYNMQTGVQQMGTSSLTGALGEPGKQTSFQHSQLSTSAALSPTTSITEAKAGHIQRQRQNVKSGSFAMPVQRTKLTGSHANANKDATTETILRFRSIVENWARAAPPTSYFEVSGIKVFKDEQSLLHMMSQVNGQTISEDSDTFFNRLWSAAQSGPKVVPLNPGSTNQAVHSSEITPTDVSGLTGTIVQSGPKVVPSTPTAAKNTETSRPTVSAPAGNDVVAIPAQNALASSGPASTTPLLKATTVDIGGGKFRSPQEANKKRLARDVLFALGKRKQDRPAVSPSKDISVKRQALDSNKYPHELVYDSIPRATIDKAIPLTTRSSLQGNNQQALIPIATPAPATQIGITSLPTLPVPKDPAHFNGQLLVPSDVQASKTGSSISSSVVPVPKKPDEGQHTTAPTDLSVAPNVARTKTPPPLSSTTATNNLQPNSQPPPVSSTVSPQLLLQKPLNIVMEPSREQTRAIATNTSQSHMAPHTSTTSAGFPSRSYPSSQWFSPQPLSWINVHANTIPPAPFKADSSVSLMPSKPVTLQASTSTVSANDNQHFAATVSPQSTSTSKASAIEGATPLPDTGSTPSRRNLSPIDSTSTVAPREPLFLPSPSTPTSEEMEFILKGRQIESSSISTGQITVRSNKKKWPSAYVLVPPPPPYLVRYREQEAKKSRRSFDVRSSIASGSLASRSSEDLLFLSQRDSFVDPDEQEAIRLSCSRLQELPCRWTGCDIITNSVDSLIQHLNQDHKAACIQNGSKSFICRWTQCGRQCSVREKHIEKHASLPLRCAYQGCHESYRSSSQLLKHFRAKHSNTAVKPQARPFPTKARPLAPLPNENLPSYLIVTTPVIPISISQERHSEIGPLVLSMIAGSNLTKPKRTKKPSRSLNGDASPAETSNSYEFLTTRTTLYSWYQSHPVDMSFEDLDSVSISRECEQGLTLWASPDGGDEEITFSDDEDDEKSLLELSGDASRMLVDSEQFDLIEQPASHDEPSDDEAAVRRILME